MSLIINKNDLAMINPSMAQNEGISKLQIPQKPTASLGNARACQRRLRTETCPVHLNIKNYALKFDEKKLMSIPDSALEVIIKYGRNPYNWSPLRYALELGDLESAQILIDAGLFLNSVDNNTGLATPSLKLLELCQSGISPIKARMLLLKLLEKGIDPSLSLPQLSQNQGEKLIWYAIEGRENKVVEVLLDKYKINPNLSTGKDSRIIHSALARQNPESVKILINYGAKLDDIDCFSFHWHCPNNPMGGARAADEFKESIMFLINNGASLGQQSMGNPLIKGVDFLLQKVISIPENKEFKKEVIPFLIELGAKI